MSQRRTQLQVERLEERDCPSGGYLFVGDYDGNSVLRYDETTGAFVDEFVPHNSGGLNQPQGLVFGPNDHNLYVTSGELYGRGNDKAVMRFNGTTGAFVDNFTGSDHLNGPHAVVFGPDGNLYVADGFGTNGHVARFNGATGAFMGEFVPPNTPGQRGPFGLVFGPGHPGGGRYDLYVTSLADQSVRRYDGATGAPLGEFVASGSGGLQLAVGLTFGPDGNLYVTSAGAFSGGVDTIMRFHGRTGSPMPSAGNSGAVFVAAGSGGLLNTWGGPLFGPDGNGDGRQDLYVASFEWSGNNKAKAKTASIKRYDGVTGGFIDTFVSLNSGGLDQPNYMTFTETDPMTLAYRGGDRLRAESLPAMAINETVGTNQEQPLLTEAISRWQSAGVDTSALGNIQIQITDLGGTSIGLASGHTIWLDDNAAGWGWFVDRTPWDDSEFTTPGNQGEQNRMDLLTVLEHEIGHLLGCDHETHGVMVETLAAGVRRTSVASDGIDWLSALDVLFALSGQDNATKGYGPLRHLHRNYT